MATRKELIAYGKDYLTDLVTAACKIEDIHKQFVAESVKALEFGKWISVNDRLPNMDEYQDNNGCFIVTDGNRRYAAYYDIYECKKFGCVESNFRIEPDDCVIAWMPMPKYNDLPFES